MDNRKCDENSKTVNPSPSVKKMELKDDARFNSYITWENFGNNCWLNASMALVAHNRVMKNYSRARPESMICEIISDYNNAICVLNDPKKDFDHRLQMAKTKLGFVQKRTLTYFEAILKYKVGDPESAFCCLYNLLIQNSTIRDIFDASWLSVKQCTYCGNYTERRKKKPIITLSEIDSFDPENPSVLYNCSCNKSVQKIKLVYAALPPCLIFHFESEAGKENPPLSFNTLGREYHLTGIMTLEKSQDLNVNHFITWIRDPTVNKWLDCNDLNIDLISYSPGFPDIKFQDVYMYVYESFDGRGTILERKVENKENTKSNEAIPIIDLSDESDTENKAVSNSDLQDNASFVKSDRDKSENINCQIISELSKDAKKMEVSTYNSQLQDTSVESDKDKSDNNCSQKYAPGFNKGTRKMEFNSQLQDTSVESDKAISDKCSQKYASEFNTDTRKGEISASESLQGNTSSVESMTDKFENSCALNNSDKDIRKIEICASVISDGDKALETEISADNMQTFTAYREITQADFLHSLKTAATTSGTSYVNLSVRKRSPGVPGTNSINEVNNPDCGESSSKTIYSPSCSNSVKETRELKRGVDEDYVPSGVPKKKQIVRRISNAEKGVAKGRSHNSKAKVRVLKTGLKKSLRINPKLKDSRSKKGIHDKSYNNPSVSSCQEGKNPEEYQLSPEQCHFNLGTASETENSTINANVDAIKILKDYEDNWAHHESDCECELANFEEEIDAVVDFTFAYLCQLSKMAKKPSSH